MYATKTPSLRIVHSDLKCKSGCGFYGNAQWQGYCSKCHREQVHRQRRTEKANSSQAQPNTSPSLQREHQVLERQPKASPVAGFTKFEEKKSRQSDSLKKTKLLNVFRKTSNAKDVGNSERESRDRGPSELVIPTNSLKMQRHDFHQSFPNLDSVIERDTRKHVEVLISRISKQYQSKTVDELSDMTQNFYQLFAQRMDTNPHYSEVDAETRELLLDFVEKYAMTYLHGIFFSPGSCDDERKDAQIHARIRKLCWVSPQHLDCRIDQGNARVRDLLYAAISELVAMDSVLSPGSKLAHVVGCCRGVVGVVGAAGGGPASADELLPALIFTVLKANPPRLTSNINFVTRFCNAARLMTGEGGYYFTNLCCAVSFIENLTPESLNMTKDDFDGYMSLPSIVGGGSWVAALSLCEGLHEIQDQIKDLQELERRTIAIDNMTKDLDEQVETFQDEIMKKVADVLARTPLDINAKKYTPPATQEAETAVLIEPVTPEEIQNPSLFVQDDVIVKKNDKSVDIFDTCTDDNTVPLIVSAAIPTSMENIFPADFSQGISEKINLPPNSLVNLTTALDNPPISTLKTISSAEFLSPSPLFGYGCFDTQSLDELATPDDFSSEQFLNRLTNVNYDIDLSDLSAENSAAEDLPILPNEDGKMKHHDPFSPEGLTMTEHAQAWQAMQAESLKPSDNLNFYTPMLQTQIQDEAASILDANDSPTTDCLLPSPIKPLNTSYQDSYK